MPWPWARLHEFASRLSNDEETIQELIKRIEELEQQLAALQQP